MSSVGNDHTCPQRGPGVELRWFNRRSGLTLVELLLVLGIVALAAGSLGRGLLAGDPAVSLEASQRLISSLLVAARTEAAATRTRARLLIYADVSENEDTDKKLRFARVVRRRMDGSWDAVGAGIYLPKPARILPSAPPPVRAGASWGSSPLSSFNGEGAIRVMVGDGGQTARYHFIEFSPLGTMTAATLVISPGETTDGPSPSSVIFHQPNDVRGIKLSQYGAQTFLPDANAF